MENGYLKINNKEYFCVITSYYNGPLDFYIPSCDIYIRSFGEKRNLWAMFQNKGDLGLLSYDDLFNNYKIWTPLIMTDSFEELHIL